MAITDIAGNPLAPATTGEMLGFVVVEAEEVLPLRAYDFILRPIRHADEQEGNFFVRRLFDAAQSAWETTQSKIFAVKDLWSFTDIPDEFLPYLKDIVGWTKEPVTKRVTDALSSDELRRLIPISVPFWKTRGPEDTIVDILASLTGQRSRVWNWFDLRWVLDETVMGEEHEGRDPWIIDLPGEGNDEYRFNVRVVDPVLPSPLNRDVVVNLLKLVRPAGERIEVAFIDFLDQFRVDGDDAQWTLETGTALEVAGGSLNLSDTGSVEEAALNPDTVLNSSNWAGGILAYARVRATEGAGDIGLRLYRADASNYYEVKLSVGTYPAVAELTVTKLVAGVPTVIAGPVALPQPIEPGTWLGLRVSIEPNGSTNEFKVYLDGDLVASFTDSALTTGALSVFHSAGCDLAVGEVEVFQTPLDTETIDINAG
jgi:hypothetical protein